MVDPLAVALPPLLLMSAFFSGSETALFGLSQAQRRRMRGSAARASARLLARPRELLVTLMIGNMAANVTYFVITSVLALRAESAASAAWISLACLSGMILLGEVTPKLVATGSRERWCSATVVAIEWIHVLIGPLRAPVSALIGPLSRLAPKGGEHRVTHRELGALLSRSAGEGAIDAGEAEMLSAVAELSALRARDVMTPRGQARSMRADATRAEVIGELRERPVARVVVCERDFDAGVLGVLDTAEFLSRAGDGVVVRTFVRSAVFVPESATLEGVLASLRAKRESVAVVVDEYGGVSGVVTAGDIVSRLVGERRSGEGAIDEDRPVVEDLGGGVFRVPGRLAVREWKRLLGLEEAPRGRTVGGVVMEKLGRPAHTGDTVRLGSLTIRVESLEGRAVATALVSVESEGAP